MPDTAKLAAVTATAVTYSQNGDSTLVSASERRVRAPEPAEVRVAVAAAAASPTDMLLRDMPWQEDEAPRTPGMDAAGVIEAIGPGVTRLAVGEEVMVALSPRRPEGGGQASVIVVPAASVVRKPAGSTLAQASTIPMNGLTALYALDLAGLAPGQTLAVTGGAGWLAYVTIVLAKLSGLKVIADAKTTDFDLVRSYGANIVVERGEGFVEAVRAKAPDGVDALLDTALLGEKSFPAIADGGIYIPVRGWAGTEADRGIQIKPVMVPDVLERTDWLEELRQRVEAGDIVPLVAGEFTAEKVSEAHQMLTVGGVRGRPVITFSR
jgi:NADPH:quinone reductase-like Zn-dependent oxidoreductase